MPDVEGPSHTCKHVLPGSGQPKRQKFKSYPIGYFHINIAEVRTEEGKLHLFVAIDRTSKFAVAQLVEKANRKTAWEFLEHLLDAVPYKIHTVLTNNGIQFAEQPRNRDSITFRKMRFDLRKPRSASQTSQRLHRRLQLCSSFEDTQWSHTLRVHLQNLDIRARPIHPKSDPPDAGTEQLGKL